MTALLRLAVLFQICLGSAFAQDRVAVIPFDGAGGLQVRKAIADEISAGLARYSQFVVLERTRILDVLSEHDLADRGYVAPEEAIEAGKLLGAEKVILGTITDFRDRGLSIISVTARVVDVERGTVQDGVSVTVSGRKGAVIQEAAALIVKKITLSDDAPLSVVKRPKIHLRFSYSRMGLEVDPETPNSPDAFQVGSAGILSERMFKHFLLGARFHYGQSPESTFMAGDIGFGVRLPVIPKIVHVYGYGGVTVNQVSYTWDGIDEWAQANKVDLDTRKVSAISPGVFGNAGIQVFVFPGLRAYAEIEYRQYAQRGFEVKARDKNGDTLGTEIDQSLLPFRKFQVKNGLPELEPKNLIRGGVRVGVAIKI